jgi:hypothetical protein
MTDTNNSRLPRPFIWIVVAICLLPTLLNWCGVDFSTQGKKLDRGEIVTSINDIPELLRSRMIKGPLLQTVLECSAFCVALVTAVFALIHFTIRRDVTTPIIGTALFVSGLMDAFNVLAANSLLLHVIDYENFIPFTWAISRTFNVCIMAAGTGLFLRRGLKEPFGRPTRSVLFIILVGVLFSLVAYVIVVACAVTPQLPKSLFPGQLVPRRYDAIPLMLYLFAGGVIFPRFYRMYPSLFSHSLIIGVVPQIATQLHAAIGSNALYDNHFNVAYFLKIVAYIVPLVGLIWEYTRTYRDEVHLKAVQESLRIAREIQLDLLPQRAPQMSGFDLAGRSFPAESVGGDYFDFIPMSDNCLGLVTADVSGHDIGASIFMTQTRAYLRALARTHSEPTQIIQLLNRFLVEDAQDRRFVSLFFAKLNPRTQRFTYCPSGYMSYLLTRKNVWQKLESSSLPLGIIEDGQTAPSTQITLEHRDIFLSFTDGVVEAVSPAGAQFGIDRALEIVIANRNLPAEEIVNAVYAAINDFCCGAAPVDDITIVVLKRDRAGDEPDAAEQSRQNRSPHRKRHR